MISEIGILNNKTTEDFSVLDSDGNLIDSINVAEFTVNIYDPYDNEVSASVSYNFENIGNGHYRFNFFPDEIGTWYIIVYHPTYFSVGKAANIKVYESEDSNYGAIGIINEEITEDFSVIDYNNELKNDVNLNDLQVELYSPNNGEVSSVTSITFVNLDNGHYRAKYTPDIKGNWYLVVYHPVLFPYGKASSIDVFNALSIGDNNQGGAFGYDEAYSKMIFNHKRIPKLRINIVEKIDDKKNLGLEIVER